MEAPNFYEQLCEEEKQLANELDNLSETLKAVRLLKARYEKKNGQKVSTIVNRDKPAGTSQKRVWTKGNFPTLYDSGLTQFQKTYVALHLLKRGFAVEIGKKLHEIAPQEFDKEKAYKVAREKASDLYQMGVFGVERFGRKYRYFIKQKSPD